jgi:hypothetical protein
VKLLESIKNLDAAVDAADFHLSHLLERALDDNGSISEARRAGLSWDAIVETVVKHGPNAAGVLQAVTLALRTTPVGLGAKK